MSQWIGDIILLDDLSALLSQGFLKAMTVSGCLLVTEECVVLRI